MPQGAAQLVTDDLLADETQLYQNLTERILTTMGLLLEQGDFQLIMGQDTLIDQQFTQPFLRRTHESPPLSWFNLTVITSGSNSWERNWASPKACW